MDESRDEGTGELLDELPEGDEGWEYVREGDTGVTEDSTHENDDGEKDGEDGVSAMVVLERAARNGASRYEAKEAVKDVGVAFGKGDVIGFVREADGVAGSSFSEGDVWEGDDGYAEFGWVENGEITAFGASVLAQTRDLVDEAGDEAALVGYLNSKGVETFLVEAVERGPDDEEDSDGFIGGLFG